MAVNLRGNVVYLIEDNGIYETVNIDTVPKGAKVFSFEKTTLDEAGVPDGKFFFVPEIEFATQVEPKQVEIISNPIGVMNNNTGIIVVDEVDVEVPFVATTDLDVMVAAINNAVSDKLGVEYSSFAVRSPDPVTGDRIKLRTPFTQNTSIIIPPSSVWTNELAFKAGYYPGDLPTNAKSYVENEAFILTQESVTPNNGTPSGIFIPQVASNNMRRYVSEFDRSLIDANPRLKLLVDGFAYMIQRVDDEMSRFIDQIDLSKVDADNIEYLAYLFGIDLEDLLTPGTDLINAREVLRSIMRIIQIKGSNTAFDLMLKFVGLDTQVLEFRPDGTEITQEITQQAVNEFYDRFIIRDTKFRNPAVNFGSEVADFSDLPAQGYDGEIIRVFNSGAVYQYSLDEQEWIAISNTLSPIVGRGTEPDERIDQFNWRFVNTNQPYLNIPASQYNPLKIISGFDILAGDGNIFGVAPFVYDPDISPMRGQIVSNIAEPYNMSSASQRRLVFIVDEQRIIDVDFNEFSNLIGDFGAVTNAEIKNIIEQLFDGVLLTTTPDGSLVIKSERLGTGSSLRILEENIPMGFPNGLFNIGANQTTQLKITAGTANPSADQTAIPQVTFADQIINIQGQDGGDPLDGDYSLYINGDGEIIVQSLLPFLTSIFIPELGYVTDTFTSNDATLIGTVTSLDGQFIAIEQQPRQSDYAPSLDLNEEQEAVVRGFIRGKLTVANREPAISEVLPFDQPFYLRTGERNTSQPNEPGVDNSVVLSTTPINDDFLLTQEVVDQVSSFIDYVRPVHILLLSVLLNLPELRDQWPIVLDRTRDGDYSPGFWDGSQSTKKITECWKNASIIYDSGTYTNNPFPIIGQGGLTFEPTQLGILDLNTVDGVNTTFYTNHSQVITGGTDPLPIVNRLGQPSGAELDNGVQTGSLIKVIADGQVLTPVTDYTVESNGEIELAVAPQFSVCVDYLIPDRKAVWELDIISECISARKFDDGWFTSGDDYVFASPTSGEQKEIRVDGSGLAHEVVDSEWVLRKRENRLFENVRITATPETGIGTANYQAGKLFLSGSDPLDQLTQTFTHNDDPKRVVITAQGNTPPAVGTTITFQVGSGDPSAHPDERVYTVVAGIPALPYEVEQGADAFAFLENLRFEIEQHDGDNGVGFGGDLNAEFSDRGGAYTEGINNHTLVVTDLTGTGLSANSTFGLNWSVTSMYLPQKKPQVVDKLNAIIIADLNEDASVGVLDNIMDDGLGNTVNSTTGYFNYVTTLHRGHTNKNIDPADLATETYTENFVFRGISNGAIGGDWEDPASYVTNDNLGTPYFHGSENYDGSSVAELSFGLGNSQVQINNHYTDALDPTAGRNYRNRSMHNGEPQTVQLLFNGGPFPLRKVFLLKGVDIDGGKLLGQFVAGVPTVGSLLEEVWNGGAPTNDLLLVLL